MKCIFGVDCNGIEFDCNVNCEKIIFENEDGNENNCGDYELLHELYCPAIYPTTYPAPRPPVTIINFNNSRIELRENLDLEYIFGVDCNVNCKNIIFENENDWDDLFYGYDYPRTPSPTPTPLIKHLLLMELIMIYQKLIF